MKICKKCEDARRWERYLYGSHLRLPLARQQKYINLYLNH